MLSNQNFGPVRQGDTYRIDFALHDTDGSPLLVSDIASAVFTWSWAITNGGAALGDVAAEIVDGGDGTATARVLVPTAAPGFFFHELEMVLSGDTSTMATGTFSVEREIIAET